MAQGRLNSGRGIGAFFRDRKAAVSIIAALSLPALVAFSSLVAEYGHGLLIKTEDQRVADLAAYAGALAYNSVGTAAAATSAANNVAALNGVTSANVSSSVVSSPTGDGNSAIKVRVSSNLPLYLASVVGGASSLPVAAAAYAEMGAPANGCIIALSGGGTGVKVSSAAGISASGCAVSSNAGVAASSASNITTIAVNYNSSSPPSATSASTIAAPAGKTITITKRSTADPLAGNAAVAAATLHLHSVEQIGSPAAPSVTAGTNLTFNSTTFGGTMPSGCAAPTRSGATWTVTCTSGGAYNFGSLAVSSTATVNFNTGGSAATTYNFSGGVSAISSAHVNFGPGTFNIAQGVTIASASSGSFGAGIFNIGRTSGNCSDGGQYSLCVQSSTSLSFGGPSIFTLAGGLYAGSSASITLGSGATNSFDLGSSSNGNAVQTASSSNVLFADATGAVSQFVAVGNITAASAACVSLPDAAAHDVNGSIIANSASNTTFGAGVYTVSGYLMDQSASGGGGCLGSTAGTAGTGVTFVLGAQSTPSSGTCQGEVICVTSASALSLIAPTSGATAGLAVIGPTDGSTAGALFQSASSGTLSGAVYLPNGPITVSSAASLGGGSATCMELIGSEITVSSASAVGSTCIGLGGASGGGAVTLVQ
ncbi:MAG TPA: hypothetical protein VIJ94_14290 [Caulobacteraceae bacterium]